VTEQQTQADYALTVVILALIVIVFVLDLLTPLGIVIWVLYVIPLGLTSWSAVKRLLPISAGVCSVLILLGYFYSPPGVSFEYAVINRSLGIAMLWVVVFFLWPRQERREPWNGQNRLF
jgi:hypothetical protein